MSAQPLTTSTLPRSNSPTALHTTPEQAVHSFEPEPQVRRSWSLKRLLSGRGSPRYRVLEREPNRLRKRVAA
ncbi:uncharacterized protein N7473_005069 [Penicillium subrubescens]|uniref:Uncharacterized protein n=1 Tax=Penicillium subrubescens TaxID=1316194 RepID=A0A1Q5UDG4_9EURO|nr:uncharacterized protein N7473_005069 [Penicillium subrubescens]KAJ5900999.1 hypothetical protein N7473_005069 [Penicillium subrubescens]OKP10515.1 hypothetical protein PENSUB_3818 [Penicillium subrubescens]